MQDNWRAGIAEDDKTQIVTKGIYKISRNPAFLGFDFMYIGILLAFANALCLVVTLLTMLLLHFQILEEERFLIKAFGQDYTEYKQNTGRYLPRVFNYLFFAAILIVIGVTIGYYQITPTSVPSDYKEEDLTIDNVRGKATDFSMTMNHLKNMTIEPHASGSKEIEKVREYLVQQFDLMGCDYQVHKFKADMKAIIDEQVASFNSYIEEHPEERASYDDYFASLGFASYEEKYRASIYCTDSDYINGVNYFVKVDAPKTEKGVLFVSHYDSTTNGPGTGDDLISVASMLEALRDVKYKNNLNNDMYFLFTDAEELNLLGAAAFVRDFPEMKEKIDLVINLEARGNKGTLLMFETSEHNKEIAKALNNAVDHNSMFSFFAAIYKTMPNDTDLTEFLEAGYPGMNFAVIGGPETYHQSSDNYENLDRNSAYMYFKTTSGLADYFSTADLETLKSDEDAVYFPFMKGNSIIVSNTIMLVFSCIAGISTLIWILFLLIRKQAKIKDCIITFALMLASIFVAVGLGLAGTYICNKISNNIGWTESIGSMNLIFYILCFLTITEVLLFIYFAAKRAKSKLALPICGMLLFNIINWICVYFLNSLAYIFTIPLCILFLYSVYKYAFKNHAKEKYFTFGAMIISSLIILLLYTPIIYLLYTALLSSLLFGYMILATLAILPIAILCSALFILKNVRI